MACMATPEERLTIEAGAGHVTGTYARPADPLATLVVAHGAGAGMDHPFMVGFTRAMNDEGVATLRFNFPYIESGRRSPDPAPYLGRRGERRSTRRASSKGEPVWAGGKSLGGRIASMAVAEEACPRPVSCSSGIRCTRRASPSGSATSTCTGSRSRCCSWRDAGRVRDAGAAGAGDHEAGDRATLIPIEGGDHSFNVRGAKRDAREVAAALADGGAFIRERLR